MNLMKLALDRHMGMGRTNVMRVSENEGGQHEMEFVITNTPKAFKKIIKRQLAR